MLGKRLKAPECFAPSGAETFERQALAKGGVSSLDLAALMLVLSCDNADEGEGRFRDARRSNSALAGRSGGKPALRLIGASAVAVDGRRIGRELVDNVLVPRISAFYGIVVTMYWRDHRLPHHRDHRQPTVTRSPPPARRLPLKRLRFYRVRVAIVGERGPSLPETLSRAAIA